ncbi:SnoaL-like polyketide cyclase [Paracoccus isoporae]|uniref:SnoaL-like polyketide cyclase n=1 Tax=Paracoccus isoporae TaxID=591205 RepID=A0A1G6ZBF5_9RHOB|nr:ester cyclase [Paracoccus isoporae]SDD99841.1 SnoaL-like polyketide cyclase [Paracoccus isoporae]
MTLFDDRKQIHARLSRLAESEPRDLRAALEGLYAADAQWRGSHPLNEMCGRDAIAELVWSPLQRAFPDLERRDLIFMGGRFEGRDYIAAMGHFCGTFARDWLGIPATGLPAYLRYGEVHQIEDGRIVQSSCLWDVLDLIRQAGFWPIAPSMGAEGMWPGPITADGIILTPQDPAEGARNLSQTLAMHATLGAYDDEAAEGRDGLLNMPQKQHWHPRMMWYGPSGIGTARGLAGFVDCHQLPFRSAFPNRKGGGQWDEIAAMKAEHGGGHYIRVGEGAYSVTAGWPSVFAMHQGGGFLGLAPTGRPVTMRVMDFYLHHEGLIRENWVPLDMLDLLNQMGVDVLARLQSQIRRPGRH